MTVGDLDESSSRLDSELEHKAAFPSPPSVRIVVSTRPHWHQLAMMRLDSDELTERLEAILRADWLRFLGQRRVEVRATDNLGNVRSVIRDPWPSVCPHCGHEL